jgi:aminomethyltransferase
MTEFAGWDMPVRYTSDLAEHLAVRAAVGLFDLSHMGEIVVEGPGAGDALDFALVGWASGIEVGRARYSMIVAEDGGVIDDLVVYRTGPECFLVVANAGNAAVVVTHVVERCGGFDCAVRDESAETALIAVQGPRAAEVVATMLEGHDRTRALSLKYYASAPAAAVGAPVTVARTGYTGEDGFEFFCPVGAAEALWDLSLVAGAAEGIVPCGLAARDTLRLEAGMPLYGHELTRDRTPFEAGLGRVVAFGDENEPRGDFVGRDALVRAAARVARWESEPTAAPDSAHVLVGLAGEGRRAARAGYQVLGAAAPVGEVTSGAPSPSLGHPIAMAYVHPSVRGSGTDLDVDVRGRRERMTVCALPFYHRSK